MALQCLRFFGERYGGANSVIGLHLVDTPRLASAHPTLSNLHLLKDTLAVVSRVGVRKTTGFTNG